MHPGQVRSPNMKMTILERNDEITHVVLSGRLDTTGTEQISGQFSEATAGLGRPAIVDLSEIEFMASRGIGLLLTNGKKLVKAGQRMVLLNPQELVESGLKLSKVDSLMPIAHDLDEAIQILLGRAGFSDTATVPSTAYSDDSHVQPSEPVSTTPTVREGELKLAIDNEASELKDLSTTVTQFLDDHNVPHRAAYAIDLAIDELVTNVMRYAYVDAETHLIDIELAVEREQALLRIVDDGRPFDPRRGPALDLHAENRDIGGLGLILVLDMVDTLKYRRVDDKNCVEVRVSLFAEGSNGDLSEATRASSEVSEE